MQLVGGLNPSDKYWSNWINAPTCGENKIWNHHLDLDQNKSKIYDISSDALFTKVNVHNILSKIGSVSREVSSNRISNSWKKYQVKHDSILSYRTSWIVIHLLSNNISCALFSKAFSKSYGAQRSGWRQICQIKPWVCCWGWRHLAGVKTLKIEKVDAKSWICEAPPSGINHQQIHGVKKLTVLLLSWKAVMSFFPSVTSTFWWFHPASFLTTEILWCFCCCLWFFVSNLLWTDALRT